MSLRVNRSSRGIRAASQFIHELASANWQARRYSTPHHAVLETAALPIRATGLCISSDSRLPHRRSARLLMQRMFPAPITELLELQPVRRNLLILGRRIVAAFALRTLKRNVVSHGRIGPIPESRKSYRHPPSGRLRELQTATLFPSRSA